MELSTDPDVLEQVLSNRRTTLDHILCLGYGFGRPGMNRWTSERGYIATIDTGDRILTLACGEKTVDLKIDIHAPDFFRDLRKFMKLTNFHLVSTEMATGIVPEHKKTGFAKLGYYIDRGLLKYLSWRRS